MGEALLETRVAQWLGNGIIRLVGMNERVFLIVSLLVGAGLEAMGFFGLLRGSIPRFLFMILFYAAVGLDTEKKIFDFEESETGLEFPEQAQSEPSRVKMAVVIGNLMSSSASAAVLGPVAICLCAQLGYPAKPLIMTIIWGLNLAFLMPGATPPVTMTLQWDGGYPVRYSGRR